MISALRFSDLTLGYDRHPAVHHLEGSVAAGALLAVAGPNGAGKSTLLKSIAGIIAPLSGTLERGALARHDIAYLPQAAEIDRAFPICVFDLVAAGCWRDSGIFSGLGRNRRQRAHDALAVAGLSGFEQRPIGTLSGGQLQRALFARLIVQDAPLILLDEPFAAIDEATVADLVKLIRAWHGDKRTVIAVLHDLDLVRAVFPQTLLLAREVVAWGPTAETLRPANLNAARGMIEMFDPFAAACARAA